MTTRKSSPATPMPPPGVGTDYYNQFLSALTNLSSEFGRKIDDAERDTRKQFESFQTNIANQFQAITNKFESAMATRDAKFEAFSTKVLEGGRAQWPLILLAVSVGIAIIGALGTLAYVPIGQRTGNLERAMEKMVDVQNQMREFVLTNFVTQKELEARSQRGIEDRERTSRTIEMLQQSVFPRAVHEQRWARFDSDIASTNLRVDTLVQNLQREIDQIQKSLGDTYTARDALFENKSRISDLEKMIRDIISGRRYVAPATPTQP